MADGHGADLRIALNRVRRRWLAARWLHGLARVAGGAAAGLLAVIGTELLLAPPDMPLLAVSAAALAASAAFAVRALWPLRRPPSDERVARLVEERCPELEDRVASAAALDGARPAGGFQELVVADAAARLRGIDLARIVAPTRLRRAGVQGLLALAALVAVVSLGSTPLGRVARTAWLHASPSGAEFTVEPGDFRLMAGQPMRIRARFADGGGAPARTPPVLSLLGGMPRRDIRMSPAGDGYVAELPAVTRSFRYRVSAASFTSRDYAVEALSPPRVMRIDVEYDYPPFTGLPPRVEEDGGDLFAPAGTAARIIVHTDKPVVQGALVLSDGRRLDLVDAGDARRRAATLIVDGDGRYRVRVVDAHGLSNRDAADYLVRATADRPPTVRVLRPGGDREVTPLEEVTIEVRADDDHAVARLDLVYTVVGRGERTLPFEVPADASAVTGVRTVFVEDLAVEPGDVVTYYARARDAGRAGVSTEARSDLYFLEIRPFDNEFEEALSQGGLGPQAAEIGRLVALQKQIVVATWRLDQQAGRRDDDVRAVAAVQGGVRDETAGAVGAAGPAGPRFGRDRRGRGDGGAGPAVQRRALEAAVEAMTAAEAALEALDTASALPHETEALDRLLTAQAAVRRRQVSMQPRGGAGGRQAPLDLSQLFDRELRREQETSYETGRQPGEPEAGGDDRALDRLRELARRQERLNQELRRSPETGTPEERQRRLERLRREQQALRAEAEALAERLGGRPGADGRSGSGGTPREDLRRAADEMRRAGGGLRREDAEAAREHGDRAADALRRLAERLRGDPGGPPGGLVDLQIESQQLAEAQRRLARETASAAEGEPGSPYREMVAGEKDDLAERAETLERGLSSMRGAVAGEPADGESGSRPMVAEAHRTLVRERVADRLRAAAERLRSGGAGTSGGGSPPSDEQADEAGLADALATVAGLLRQAMMNDEEQRRLAAGLEAARRLRERLEASGSSGQEAAAELADHPELRRALGGTDPGLSADLERWARQWRSRSAPGTDPARLDVAHWTSLRRDLVTALRRFESDRARDLAARALRDRYAAPTDDAVPERYRRLVDQYYRSLAGAPSAVP